MRVQPVRPVFTGAGGAVYFDSLRGVFFMSDLRKAAQQALEALENAEGQLAKPYSTEATDAITALRAALEQPEPTPECSWMQDGDHESDVWAAGCGRHRYFAFNEGSPSESGMKYCFHCGKKLVEVPIDEDES